MDSEKKVEAYLVKRVAALGGFTRKLQWVGHNGAPDRLVVIGGVLKFVEVKAPGLAASFPSNPHERAQAREHGRLRAVGQQVFVVDSPDGVDEVLNG
jgi:hypothetical protein